MARWHRIRCEIFILIDLNTVPYTKRVCIIIITRGTIAKIPNTIELVISSFKKGYIYHIANPISC